MRLRRDSMNKLKDLIENILYKYNYRPCENCICFHCNNYFTCNNGCKTCKNKSNKAINCFEYKKMSNDVPKNFLLGIIILIIVLLFLF